MSDVCARENRGERAVPKWKIYCTRTLSTMTRLSMSSGNSLLFPSLARISFIGVARSNLDNVN